MKPQRHRLLLSRVTNFGIVGAFWELLFEKCQFGKTLLVGQLFVRENMEGIHELEIKLGFNQWIPEGWSNEPGHLVMKLLLINGKMRKQQGCIVSF